MAEYYDGTKLLSYTDINGNRPEIYICTSNRTAGKTTFFSRMLINRYKKTAQKFMLLYRFNYELDECADKFFKDIKTLFFSEDNMTSVRRANGIFHELFLNNKPCGYAVALNNADALKKYSHFFSDVQCVMFDEFQSETNHYCPNETQKYISIHTSVARGQGKQVRYVPVYMVGNPVSLLNPYYVEMGISNRLKQDTHFLRGDGFVLEQGFNASACEAQEQSAFMRAFSNNQYVAYGQHGTYLNDNLSFIETPQGRSTYMMTIKYMGENYAVRQFADDGLIYCDHRADITHPIKIAVTTDDLNINYVMIKQNERQVSLLRYFFDHGCFRFKDLQCKEAILKTLSY